MRITAIDVYQVDLPYTGGTYLLSGGRSYTSFDGTFVRITCDDGTTGWGESTPFGSTYIAAHALGTRAALEVLAPALLGRDPRQVDRNFDLMDATLVGHNDAKAALDVACWDAFGKSVGLPVSELLGGWTGDVLPTISSIHVGEPEEMRARVADHRARGYLGHSIKIGTLDADGGPAVDAARIIASLADRQPGEWFLVDANGGLSPENARRLFSLLPDGLDFVLEAPCGTRRESLSVRAASPYPIILDELALDDSDLAWIIANDAADGFGLKISPAGGLTPARRQRDIARAAGLTMTVQDTTGSSIAFAAIVQLAATVPARYLRCILNCADMVTTQTADVAVEFVPGGVQPLNAPGLGISVHEGVLGAPVRSWAL